MLQEEEADDYVIATGEAHTVRELVDIAFSILDLQWRDYVVIDETLFRPAEVQQLRGDSSKARRLFGWRPRISFSEIVRKMVVADLQALSEKSPRELARDLGS